MKRSIILNDFSFSFEWAGEFDLINSTELFSDAEINRFEVVSDYSICVTMAMDLIVCCLRKWGLTSYDLAGRIRPVLIGAIVLLVQDLSNRWKLNPCLCCFLYERIRSYRVKRRPTSDDVSDVINWNEIMWVIISKFIMFLSFNLEISASIYLVGLQIHRSVMNSENCPTL